MDDCTERLTCPITQDVICRAVCVEGVHMELTALYKFMEHERMYRRHTRHPCTRKYFTEEDLKAVFAACVQEDVLRLELAERGIAREQQFIEHFMAYSDDNAISRHTFVCRVCCIVCVARDIRTCVCVLFAALAFVSLVLGVFKG